MNRCCHAVPHTHLSTTLNPACLTLPSSSAPTPSHSPSRVAPGYRARAARLLLGPRRCSPPPAAAPCQEVAGLVRCGAAGKLRRREGDAMTAAPGREAPQEVVRGKQNQTAILAIVILCRVNFSFPGHIAAAGPRPDHGALHGAVRRSAPHRCAFLPGARLQTQPAERPLPPESKMVGYCPWLCHFE